MAGKYLFSALSGMVDLVLLHRLTLLPHIPGFICLSQAKDCGGNVFFYAYVSFFKARHILGD